MCFTGRRAFGELGNDSHGTAEVAGVELVELGPASRYEVASFLEDCVQPEEEKDEALTRGRSSNGLTNGFGRFFDCQLEVLLDTRWRCRMKSGKCS